ncbi:hypothetical protein GE21DRAFT_1176955, partial [Neurospora crassa]
LLAGPTQHHFTGWTEPSDRGNPATPDHCTQEHRKDLVERTVHKFEQQKARDTAKDTAKPRDSESDDEPSTPRRSKKAAENLAKRITALQ